MSNQTKVKPFRHACNKALPLVYDDSLSYYESVCKLVAKINEMVEVLNNITVDILDEANAYTDTAISSMEQRVNDAVSDVQRVKKELDKQYEEFVKVSTSNYDEFSKVVNSQMLLFNNKLNNVYDVISDTVDDVNNRTDLAIEQNNENLLTELGKTVSKAKILNFFTGESIGLQGMIDYLCMLHVEDSINYNTLVDRNVTYSNLANRNVSYTDLVLHGNSYII